MSRWVWHCYALLWAQIASFILPRKFLTSSFASSLLCWDLGAILEMCPLAGLAGNRGFWSWIWGERPLDLGKLAQENVEENFVLIWVSWWQRGPQDLSWKCADLNDWIDFGAVTWSRLPLWPRWCPPLRDQGLAFISFGSSASGRNIESPKGGLQVWGAYGMKVMGVQKDKRLLKFCDWRNPE